MQQLLLNNKLTLSFETAGKKVRLVISEAEVELACRKETLRNLKHFLGITEGKIFKGRLQLSKQGNIIEVMLKNKPVAVIDVAVFEKHLKV